jgi:hypothetical protein
MNHRRHWLPGLIAAVFAAPLLAQAQTPPGRTVDPLVVTPQKPPLSAKEAEALARTFARSLSEPSRLGQLSRWQTRPCAKAIGLPDAFDDFVAARVESLAGEIGAPPAPPCATNNILVVFTTEPQKLLDFIARRRTEMLGFHYAAQTKRLATFKGPVQAWYVTATVGADGTAYLDDAFAQGPGGTPGSRLSAELSSVFDAVLVVVDSAAVAGQPIGRIADDVAVHALARSPTPAGCRDLPTILDALKPACATSAALDGATEGDVAYLKGLYSTNPRAFLQLQQAGVSGSVARQLKSRSGASPTPP